MAASCRRRCGRSARPIRSRASSSGPRRCSSGQSDAAKRAFLQSVRGGTTLALRDLLGADDRRLGYAFAIPGAQSVAYAEAALPKNRRARIASDSAFADLDYALYLGLATDPVTPASPRAPAAGCDGRAHRDRDGAVRRLPDPPAREPTRSSSAVTCSRAALGARRGGHAADPGRRLRHRTSHPTPRTRGRAARTASKRSPRRTPSSTRRNATSRCSCSAASCRVHSPTFPGLESAARYQAGVEGTEVGGDWYDVLPIAEDRIVFSVGDVCGRGLAAAVIMASLRYSIRAYALEQPDPATHPRQARRDDGHDSDDNFATVVCGTLDTTAGTLTVARGRTSRSPRHRRRRTRTTSTCRSGRRSAWTSTWSYTSVTHVLPDGATLLAYTDGLIERRREHPDIGLERLRVAALTDLPIDELVPHLVDSLVTAGDDDVAVLAPPLDSPPHTGRRHDGCRGMTRHPGRGSRRAGALDQAPERAGRGAALRARSSVRRCAPGRSTTPTRSPSCSPTSWSATSCATSDRSMEVRASCRPDSVRIEVEDAQHRPADPSAPRSVRRARPRHPVRRDARDRLGRRLHEAARRSGSS